MWRLVLRVEEGINEPTGLVGRDDRWVGTVIRSFSVEAWEVQRHPKFSAIHPFFIIISLPSHPETWVAAILS